MSNPPSPEVSPESSLPPSRTAPPQPRALLVLSVLLLLGLVLVAAALFSDITQPRNAPVSATANSLRPTNTPDAGAGIGVIPISPPVQLTDYTFLRDNDEAFALHDLRGNYTLLYFGYVNCPDFCPLTLDKFTVVKAGLGDRAGNFNFVMVSVDPQRDTLADIRTYLDRYDPAFIGLQLEHVTEIESLSNELGLYITLPLDGASGDHTGHNMAGMDASATESVDGTGAVVGSGASGLPTPIVPIQIESDGYLVDHTSYSYLIDPEGRLRALFPFSLRADVILAEIERVLAIDA